MTDSIFRYTLPVDDQWHEFQIGSVHHVECVSATEVEFWAESPDTNPPQFITQRKTRLRVVGTGQDIPAEVWAHVGTCIFRDPRSSLRLVWHVIESFDE